MKRTIITAALAVVILAAGCGGTDTTTVREVTVAEEAPTPAPDPIDPSYEALFLRGCLQDAGSSEAAVSFCGCGWDYLVENYTQKEFLNTSNAIIVQEMVEACPFGVGVGA